MAKEQKARTRKKKAAKAVRAKKKTPRTRSTSPARKSSTDLSIVKEVLDLMESHQLSEIEVSMKGFHVRLAKGGGDKTIATVPVLAHHPAPAPAPHAAPSPVPAGSAEEEGTVSIKSPMVGTLYRSAAPDADPFVSVGDHLTEDTVICIIEAMKVMNEIKAETEGEIVAFLVENGEPLEFGQPILLVRPSKEAGA